MCLVDIPILISVLLKKELLRLRDTEKLLLPTMTDSEFIAIF